MIIKMMPIDISKDEYSSNTKIEINILKHKYYCSKDEANPDNLSMQVTSLENSSTNANIGRNQVNFSPVPGCWVREYLKLNVNNCG